MLAIVFGGKCLARCSINFAHALPHIFKGVDCPDNFPAGLNATMIKPTCALSTGGGAPTQCALLCQPLKCNNPLHPALESCCGQNASCKAVQKAGPLPVLGLCTYDK